MFVAPGGRVVLAILLSAEDVSRWGQVAAGVGRLCQAYAGDEPVPEVRYWMRGELAEEKGKGEEVVGNAPVGRGSVGKEGVAERGSLRRVVRFVESEEEKEHERTDSGTFLAVPEPCHRKSK